MHAADCQFSDTGAPLSRTGEPLRGTIDTRFRTRRAYSGAVRLRLPRGLLVVRRTRWGV